MREPHEMHGMIESGGSSFGACSRAERRGGVATSTFVRASAHDPCPVP